MPFKRYKGQDTPWTMNKQFYEDTLSKVLDEKVTLEEKQKRSSGKGRRYYVNVIRNT
jgi:hypothetical protein